MDEVERCVQCGTPRAFGGGSCITCGKKLPKESKQPVAAAAAIGTADTRATGAPSSAPAPAGAPAPGAPASDGPSVSAAWDDQATSFAAGAPEPRRPRARVAVAVGVVLALIASAVVFTLFPGGGDGIALALNFTAGEEYRYQLSMSLDMQLGGPHIGQQPMQMAVEETIAMRVVSVDDQGTATVEVTLEDVSAEVNGERLDAPSEDFSMEMQIFKDGRVSGGGIMLPATGGENPFATLPGMDQFTPLLPDRPVEPGDSWTKDFDVPFPFGEGDLTYSTSNHFLRYEDVDGVQAAVIQSEVAIPLDVSLNFREMLEGLAEGLGSGELPEELGDANPTIVFEGSVEMNQTNWFDPAAGQALRTEASGGMDMAMRFEGFPGGEVPDGELTMGGTFSMSVRQLS